MRKLMIIKRHLLLYLSLIILSLISFHAKSAETIPKNQSVPENGVDIQFNKKIPMRDGVHLSSIIWQPENQKKALPVVFVMTPYVSDEAHKRAVKFAKQGYIYISVDRRGRGNSEGEFNPLEDSGTDGYDVIEWLSKQPWCNGKVVMRGGSYRGMVQWKVLAKNPKNLISIIPTASVYPGHDFPKEKNIFMGFMANWLALTNGQTSNGRIFGAEAYWPDKYKKMEREGLPFDELDKLTATNSRIFKRWIAHPTEDDYWLSLNPSVEDYSKIDIPILTITGYFDGDQPGAMRYYREHIKSASKEGRNNHYLLIGPWSHGGTRKPAKEFQGFSFGEESVLDMDQLQIDWFDWVLKDGEKPTILKDKVNFYVIGQQEWHSVKNLEDMNNDTQKLYLTSPESSAEDVFHSGTLSERIPTEQEQDTFIYDPSDISNSDETFESYSYGDYLSHEDAFEKNLLIYHSSPFPEVLTISGSIKFTAAISMDVPDTDLSVKLFAIMPDGMSYFLAQDMIRARYRNSESRAELLIPGKIENYVFDGFKITSRQLPKGSRLRLIVTSLDSYQGWKGWEKNYNSGGVVSHETGKDAQTATISIHMENGSSFLEIPILR